MKTLHLLTLIVLLASISCNQQNDDGGGLPRKYNMFLKITNVDGSTFEDGTIELKTGYINESGEIIFTDFWAPFEKDNFYMPDSDFFGPLEIGGEPSETDNIPNGTIFDYTSFYVLKYENEADNDTITNRSYRVEGGEHFFDISLNGNYIVRFDRINYNFMEPWVLTVVK